VATSKLRKLEAIHFRGDSFLVARHSTRPLGGGVPTTAGEVLPRKRNVDELRRACGRFLHTQPIQNLLGRVTPGQRAPATALRWEARKGKAALWRTPPEGPVVAGPPPPAACRDVRDTFSPLPAGTTCQMWMPVALLLLRRTLEVLSAGAAPRRGQVRGFGDPGYDGLWRSINRLVLTLLV
jgi:hypothetical protein